MTAILHVSPRQRLSASTGAAVSIALLLAGLACAGPAAAGSGVTLAAPYHRSVAVTADQVAPSGGPKCSVGTFGHRIAWHPTSGKLDWNGSGFGRDSPTCAARSGGSAHGDSWVDLGIPFAPPAGTLPRSVNATWAIRASATWGISHAACPKIPPTAIRESCTVQAQVWVSASSASLVDLTTGSSSGVSPGFHYSNWSNWSRDTRCLGGGCTVISSSNGPATGHALVHFVWRFLWPQVTLNSSHRYALEFNLSCGFESIASAYSVPATSQTWYASAYAALDLFTGTDGMVLTSVTIR